MIPTARVYGSHFHRAYFEVIDAIAFWHRYACWKNIFRTGPYIRRFPPKFAEAKIPQRRCDPGDHCINHQNETVAATLKSLVAGIKRFP
jgi:hypothetical protein